MCWCVPPWVYLAWDSASWTWLQLFPFRCWEVFSNSLFKIISQDLFLLLLGPQGAHAQMGSLLSQRSLQALFIFFSFFFPYSVLAWFSTLLLQVIHQFLYLLFYWFFRVTSSLVWPSVLLGLWTFLSSSPLFSQDPGPSSLSLFWICFPEHCLFQEHCLSPPRCFPGILSCAFIWDITFILINVL